MTTRDRCYEIAFVLLTLLLGAAIAAWLIVLPGLGVAWLWERFA